MIMVIMIMMMRMTMIMMAMIMIMMMMIMQSAETNQVTTWHIPASKRGAAPPQTLLHRSPQNFQQYFSLYQQVFLRKNLTVFRKRNSLFSSSLLWNFYWQCQALNGCPPWGRSLSMSNNSPGMLLP